MVTATKNQMRILGKEGDTKVEWDPDNDKEVEAAKKSFEEYKKKGFKPFRLYDDGKKGSEIKDFDKFAEKIVFVPPMAGG